MIIESDSFHVCEFVAYPCEFLTQSTIPAEFATYVPLRRGTVSISLRTLGCTLNYHGNKVAGIVIRKSFANRSDAVMARRLAEKHLRAVTGAALPQVPIARLLS